MALEEEKAWLAGIIEGEGTIFHYMGGANKSIPVFRLFLVNSSIPMMMKAAEIMADICEHDIIIKEKHYNDSKAVVKSNAKMYMIEICKQYDVMRILYQIYCHMASKTAKAKWVLDILRNHKWGSKWTPEELQKISQIPVETESDAPEMPIRVKRQSELAGDRKSAAEMTAPFTTVGWKLDMPISRIEW